MSHLLSQGEGTMIVHPEPSPPANVVNAVMASELTTTYFGHRIRVEPFEWGYLAQVVDLRSNRRFVAASASAMRALEDAFEIIDESLKGDD
jgi:hypothetical protein